MRLTIEVDSKDGVVHAHLRRGEKSWDRKLGSSARANLLRLTDYLQARPYARVDPGQREKTWRALVARDGLVNVDSMARATGLRRNHASACLRQAMQAGKLRRLVDEEGREVLGHYVLREVP